MDAICTAKLLGLDLLYLLQRTLLTEIEVTFFKMTIKPWFSPKA